MSLTQFGSLLSFAIELEEKFADFYATASKQDDKYSDEFSNRTRESSIRKQKLERSRRENITEITLEPIEGLDKANYSITLSDFAYLTINHAEETICHYYKDAGPKLNVLESRRIFNKCFKEHNSYKKLI